MDKLQELTDKLYQEGLSKGKEAGEALLARAKEEADAIVAQARKQAEGIVAEATRQAEDLRTKAEGDTRMASLQALQATRQDIENLVVTRMTDTQVKEAMSAPEFVKGIITAVAQRFSAQESQDLSLVLPESLRSALEPFVKGELGRILGQEVSAEFSKKIAGGFRIGPKDGSYFISLTDETFRDLVGEYLRPATRKLLFGK
ncbi:MAG: hypothetical protein IJ652_07245 [Bacteroidales bacterium]|nr:hypothetical protein [Bacteroidales bacterium]